jgi:signal transduction histidine kinase
MPGIASETSERINRVSWLVIGVILLVLASAILLVTRHLRSGLRAKIIQQDGVALGAALMVSPSLTEDLPADLANDPEVLFAEISDKVLQTAQQAQQRDEVIGVRIFTETGELKLAIGGGDGDLTPEQVEQLQRGKAISWFESNAKLSEVAGKKVDTEVPLIRAIVPLEQKGRLIGAAEFILDGGDVAAALRTLDQNLWLYSGLIFLLGGTGITGAVWWAFRRLENALKLLEERTQSLLRANHELTLSAKTSAIGAITAHLIHDLKNPLFGLQSFVSARGSTEEEDWNIAQNTTERMQRVIAEIVRILKEEKTTEKYEISLEELFSLLRAKLGPQCSAAGITFNTGCSARGSVMNRDANVIILVITNIVQNAIQATPRGGEICVNALTQTGCIQFSVRDTGPGLPDHIKSTLFTPSRSTKAGGSGLGLAISKQLANHIGAELLLKESSKAGTVFELRVPDRVMVGELV